MSANNLEKYPLDENGELAYHPHRIEPMTWVDNTPFVAVMEYNGYQRATSSPLYFWKGADDRVWTMSLADMDVVMAGAVITEGRVHATWRVRKRGVVYGLEWLGDVTA
jgi:hypothetical protein